MKGLAGASACRRRKGEYLWIRTGKMVCIRGWGRKSTT
jgi:hypothetical protein